jgi:hypothetical protein
MAAGVYAQQAKQMSRIGVLYAGADTDPDYQARLAVFKQTLKQLGWNEGSNILFRVVGCSPCQKGCGCCVTANSCHPLRSRDGRCCLWRCFLYGPDALTPFITTATLLDSGNNLRLRLLPLLAHKSEAVSGPHPTASFFERGAT